jgi:hypothetical protein
MSINLADPYVRSHKLITFGKQEEPRKYCDPISDTVNANGWSISREIDQDGTILLTAGKRFGHLKYDDLEPAEIKIKVKSTKFKAPQIRAIKEDDFMNSVKFVEVPDGKARMSSSLEKDRFIERKYRESSILLVGECLSELIPEFNEITAIPKLKEITAKIKDEMGNIQREREKYKVSK